MHYIDNMVAVGAAHAISADIVMNMRMSHRNGNNHIRNTRITVTQTLSHLLHVEAANVAEQHGWDRYIVVETAPHEWPDANELTIEEIRTRQFEARAHGYVLERLPDLPVQKLKNIKWLRSPMARRVASLDGDRGYAVVHEGVIHFWRD